MALHLAAVVVAVVGRKVVVRLGRRLGCQLATCHRQAYYSQRKAI
jgi:hypothetical protein